MEEDGAALDAGPELLHLCEVRDQDPWSSSRSNAADPEQTEHAEEPSVHAESYLGRHCRCGQVNPWIRLAEWSSWDL